jgi:hypothetical protein
VLLSDLLEETIPYTDLNPPLNSFCWGEYVYSNNTRYRDTTQPYEYKDGDKKIIVAACTYTKGIIETYLLIQADEIEYKTRYEFFKNYLSLKSKDFHLIQLTEEIFNFLIEKKLLSELIQSAIDKSKLTEFIQSSIENNKLLELIQASSEEQKTELFNSITDSNISNILALSSTDQDINTFIKKVKEKTVKKFCLYKQLIIYGPAGCGKTYGIKQMVKNDLNILKYDENTIHTTFHPESSYYDFFGKVMPIKRGDVISYDFLPGPFAQALELAYLEIIKDEKNPEKILLVIDELNRGNAASIFGGLFNLLDRNENGVSQYSLDIFGMEAQWLYNKLQKHTNSFKKLSTYYNTNNIQLSSFKMFSELEEKNIESIKIFIPQNLSIVCTMNTSDQTIFSIDKAFQRRFDKRLKTADDSLIDYSEKIKIEGYEITWKTFLSNLNQFIKNVAQVDDVDNATIGAYFVKTKPKTTNSQEKEIKIVDIKFSILYYLWYDLFNGWKRKDYLLDNLDENFKNDFTPKTFQEFTEKTDKFIAFINNYNN